MTMDSGEMQRSIALVFEIGILQQIRSVLQDSLNKCDIVELDRLPEAHRRFTRLHRSGVCKTAKSYLRSTLCDASLDASRGSHDRPVGGLARKSVRLVGSGVVSEIFTPLQLRRAQITTTRQGGPPLDKTFAALMCQSEYCRQYSVQCD
jgi:hypothetical protein